MTQNSLPTADDLDRVIRDVIAEGFNPADFDIVSDEAWVALLTIHRRPNGGTQ